MFMFLGMLLLVLVGIALAIFGVVASIAGIVWLLWPVAVIAFVLIAIGYFAGKRKGNSDPESKKSE